MQFGSFVHREDAEFIEIVRIKAVRPTKIRSRFTIRSPCTAASISCMLGIWDMSFPL